MPAPLYEWLTAAEVDDYLGRQGEFDSARAAAARHAAAAYVERARADLAADYAAQTVGADIRMGAVLLASRLYARKGSPQGVAGYPEFGAAPVPRLDPDVERLLGLGRHATPRIG
jgi:hypothetical protein